MINQVDFEGYLTRAWEYREQRAYYTPGESPPERRRTVRKCGEEIASTGIESRSRNDT